ncbi:Importin subunit beta-1 [Citrus sinensis]|uniref:Importin subunit beta-1 n=1 Tax=Citrus sinensis TaxID=2711 RepID=A0ACB8M3V0_CITSI|nr:Importin subunit beta-1 [Citrus sinensis]
MALEFTRVLLNAKSIDETVRKHEEESLKQFQEQTLPSFLLSLTGELANDVHQPPAHIKQATLETLGYLCEEVSPDIVEQDHVNKILTAVVQVMNASEMNNDVRLAATRALYNALSFAQANFSNDMERDYIMRVVCEATQSAELKDIYSITAKAVREDEEPVALQAIEFWSSIYDEEIDVLEEYGSDFTGDSDIPCFYFIKQALPALIPLLLEILLKQEEDQDHDEGAWNIAMAAGTCLGLVARTVGEIVPLVIPFIEENIAKPDWRQQLTPLVQGVNASEGSNDANPFLFEAITTGHGLSF